MQMTYKHFLNQIQVFLCFLIIEEIVQKTRTVKPKSLNLEMLVRMKWLII